MDETLNNGKDSSQQNLPQNTPSAVPAQQFSNNSGTSQDGETYYKNPASSHLKVKIFGVLAGVLFLVGLPLLLLQINTQQVIKQRAAGLTPTITPSLLCSTSKATISGRIFYDMNRNQTFDPNTDRPLSHWTVFLRDSANTKTIVQTISDDQGLYTFTRVCDGAYVVIEKLPEGWSPFSPSPDFSYHLVVTNGKSLQHINFGNIKSNAATPSTLPFPTSK